MSDHSVTAPKPDGVPDAPLYPADLATALQSELAALADIETDYAAKRQRLETWAGLPKLKERIVREVEVRHKRDREPHVLRFAELYGRIMNLSMFNPDFPDGLACGWPSGAVYRLNSAAWIARIGLILLSPTAPAAIGLPLRA